VPGQRRRSAAGTAAGPPAPAAGPCTPPTAGGRRRQSRRRPRQARRRPRQACRRRRQARRRRSARGRRPPGRGRPAGRARERGTGLKEGGPCSRTWRCLPLRFSCAPHSSSQSSRSSGMRCAHPAGIVIRVHQAIFPLTERFLIARAAKRPHRLMMGMQREPIDGGRPSGADYGELRPSSRLPSRPLGMWNFGRESL
jgi:hypothetical protein